MSNADLWNSRASLGPSAGTGDLIAAELERRYIAQHVKDGMLVLDVGCGNGTTLRWLADQRSIIGNGIDRAGGMVKAAESGLRFEPLPEDHPSLLAFYEGDLFDLTVYDKYDLIYTQRCLINLPTWEQQRAAIERIIGWLKPGGEFVMVECSQDGLAAINNLRASLDLPAIVSPGHNRYLRDSEVRKLSNDLWAKRLATPIGGGDRICSTYQILSRCVNAAIARDEGHEPDYDSPINRVALRLTNISNVGQNTAWRWQRCK